MSNFALIRHRMNATGIGFAGIAGAWWLPAVEPFALPAQVAADLEQIAHAIFRLFDAVTSHYGMPTGADWGLNALLESKVPDAIARLTGEGRVRAVRPDFQLVRLPGAPVRYQLVATELEICPSAHGFAHAMQVGYGLHTDLVEQFAQLLAGRELIFAGTNQWSEFLFEQLAFCRALADIGRAGVCSTICPSRRLLPACVVVSAGNRRSLASNLSQPTGIMTFGRASSRQICSIFCGPTTRYGQRRWVMPWSSALAILTVLQARS